MPWYEYSVSPNGNRPYVTVHLWHGNRRVNLIALVDSGADCSVMDVSYADAIGLDRTDAEVSDATVADGSTAHVYRWPNAHLEIQFENDRFPFEGGFIEFPAGADPENLLGRRDFFQRYIVQFWDAAELMNIDTSPDYPRPPNP